MNGSDLIILAKEFAVKAHEGQMRKLNAEPFMNHPENVARLLYDAGFSDELVAAGYLHDVVEDTDVTLYDIETIFGANVSGLVASNTESKGLSWFDRKKQTIERARNGSLETKALIGADKFDNLTNVMKYYRIVGEGVWSVFSQGKEKQYWYYSEVAKALFANIRKENVPSYFLQYEQLVNSLKDEMKMSL